MWASSNAPGSVQAKEKEREKKKTFCMLQYVIKLQFNFLKYKY